MPYIPKVFRPELDEAIEALRKIIEKRAEDNREALLGRLGYVAFEFEKRIMPERRYHSIAECSGVLHNVPDEICRRFGITPARYEGEILIRDESLDTFVALLVNDVQATARNMIKHVSRSTTCEEVITVRPLLRLVLTGISNYSLTALALRIAESHFQQHGFNMELLRQLPTLFKRIADAFYREVAGPYEDTQIQRPENGDLQEFIAIRQHMQP